MLQFLHSWWNKDAETHRHDQTLELTVTRLMVSMMRMDDKLENSEHDEIVRLVGKRFALGDEAAEALFQEAVHANDDGPCFDDLARQINSNYDKLEVAMLLSDIWRVAEADGRIDFYEERYLSRISSLLGVSPEMVREAKLHRKAA